MKYRGILKENASSLSAVFRLTDWCVIAFSAWAAHWLYLGDPTIGGRYAAAIGLGLLLAAWLFPSFSLYKAWRGVSLIDEMRAVTTAWGSVLLALVVFAFATKSGVTYSRAWIVVWGGLGWAGLILSRVVLRAILRWMRKRGFNQRRILIVASTEFGKDVAARIVEAPWMGLKVIDCCSYAEIEQRVAAADAAAGGTPAALAAYVKQESIDQVWLAMPLRDEEMVRHILHELRHSTVDIRFVPDLFGLRLLNHSLMEVAGLPVMNLSVTPMVGMNRWLKVLEDRLLSALILVLIIPLMLLIAVGVKLSSPGPVFFKQMRYGWDGKPVKIYKFRSMVVHEECGQVTQATRNDRRVTRFGAFLRRTSLDELPQFFNVLQGRMSIVGPRPHAVAHNELYKDLIPGYMSRHKVKPGITGWAQVNGWRGETDTLEKMQKRVEFDLYYIENWSLWFDLKIILLTIFRGFVNERAY